MKMWRTRSQRLASFLALTMIALALPGCGGSDSNSGGGGTAPVTATFVSNDASTGSDLVRFSAATCVNSICTLEVSIGTTSASNYYAFAFDILISNPAIARFVNGSDATGSFLQGTVDSIASQPSDRVVVGVSKVGAIAGNGAPAEDDVMILSFEMIGTGDATLTFVGSPNNPALGNCSASGPEAIDDQNPGACITTTVFGAGGVISGG
jgi:hypothetical protein